MPYMFKETVFLKDPKLYDPFSRVEQIPEEDKWWRTQIVKPDNFNVDSGGIDWSCGRSNGMKGLLPVISYP
jgi:hypothetical protein